MESGTVGMDPMNRLSPVVSICFCNSSSRVMGSTNMLSLLSPTNSFAFHFGVRNVSAKWLQITQFWQWHKFSAIAMIVQVYTYYEYRSSKIALNNESVETTNLRMKRTLKWRSKPANKLNVLGSIFSIQNTHLASICSLMFVLAYVCGHSSDLPESHTVVHTLHSWTA
jgi:hypothetical protein